MLHGGGGQEENESFSISNKKPKTELKKLGSNVSLTVRQNSNGTGDEDYTEKPKVVLKSTDEQQDKDEALTREVKDLMFEFDTKSPDEQKKVLDEVLLKYRKNFEQHVLADRANKNRNSTKRGAFLLLEGVDRCGKTTQCNMLLEHLRSEKHKVHELLRFPDRTSEFGKMINAYLQSTMELDDEVIHKLFSINRWEFSTCIRQKLLDGETIVCDRYVYSGVAFSAAKEDKKPLLNITWCKEPDRGLPAPDVVIFLDISPEKAAERGGFGEERYEKEDFQLKVREVFKKLEEQDKELEGANRPCVPWRRVDAAQSREDVSKDIGSIAKEIIEQAANTEIGEMWPVEEKEVNRNESNE